MVPTDMFVMDFASQSYLRRPLHLKPSACTPLFYAAYSLRDAGCCIHTHSINAVLVTLLCEAQGQADVFEIETLEQIKGVPRGYGEDKKGNLGYYDRLRVPIIENTAREEDLRETLEGAIRAWPDTYAVLVRRHGIYVWGKDVAQAKTLCERYVLFFFSVWNGERKSDLCPGIGTCADLLLLPVWTTSSSSRSR